MRLKWILNNNFKKNIYTHFYSHGLKQVNEKKNISLFIIHYKFVFFRLFLDGTFIDCTRLHTHSSDYLQMFIYLTVWMYFEVFLKKIMKTWMKKKVTKRTKEDRKKMSKHWNLLTKIKYFFCWKLSFSHRFVQKYAHHWRYKWKIFSST